MTPYLTLERLIDENGDVDPVVYRHMVRRRCMNEHGAITPRALRQVVRYYAAIIPVLIMKQLAKRENVEREDAKAATLPLGDIAATGHQFTGTSP